MDGAEQEWSEERNGAPNLLKLASSILLSLLRYNEANAIAVLYFVRFVGSLGYEFCSLCGSMEPELTEDGVSSPLLYVARVREHDCAYALTKLLRSFIAFFFSSSLSSVYVYLCK